MRYNDVDAPAGTRRLEAHRPRRAAAPISELALIIGDGAAQLRRHNGAAPGRRRKRRTDSQRGRRARQETRQLTMTDRRDVDTGKDDVMMN